MCPNRTPALCGVHAVAIDVNVRRQVVHTASFSGRYIKFQSLPTTYSHCRQSLLRVCNGRGAECMPLCSSTHQYAPQGPVNEDLVDDWYTSTRQPITDLVAWPAPCLGEPLLFAALPVQQLAAGRAHAAWLHPQAALPFPQGLQSLLHLTPCPAERADTCFAACTGVHRMRTPT